MFIPSKEGCVHYFIAIVNKQQVMIDCPKTPGSSPMDAWWPQVYPWWGDLSSRHERALSLPVKDPLAQVGMQRIGCESSKIDSTQEANKLRSSWWSHDWAKILHLLSKRVHSCQHVLGDPPHPVATVTVISKITSATSKHRALPSPNTRQPPWRDAHDRQFCFNLTKKQRDKVMSMMWMKTITMQRRRRRRRRRRWRCWCWCWCWCCWWWWWWRRWRWQR